MALKKHLEVVLPFEVQATLILWACLVPVAGFILWANKHDRARITGDLAEAGRRDEFRAARPLDDEGNVAPFLTTALGDLDREELWVTIRNAVETRGIAQLAAETSLPHAEIEAALTPDGRPPYDTVVTILHALGYQLRIEPRPSGTVNR